jgi:hypothetical protein
MSQLSSAQYSLIQLRMNYFIIGHTWLYLGKLFHSKINLHIKYLIASETLLRM